MKGLGLYKIQTQKQHLNILTESKYRVRLQESDEGKNEHFSWKKILLITKSSLPGTVPWKACKSQLSVHTKNKSHPLNSWLLRLPRLCE